MMKRVLVTLLCLFVVSVSVHAYGSWPQETSSDPVIDCLERLEQAIEQATVGRSAHPTFLEDLTAIATDLRAALTGVEADEMWGDYVREPARPLVNVAGDWSILANNTRGALSLEQQGTRLDGTVLGNKIADGHIEPDGTIYFIRTGCNQVYTGVVDSTGTKMTGTFDCPVTRSPGLHWEAERK